MGRSADYRVSGSQGSILDQGSDDVALSGRRTGIENCTDGVLGRVCLQFEDFGFERQLLEQEIYPFSGQSGNRDHLGRASPFDRGYPQLRQLSLYLVGAGSLAIDLVDRHDDGDASGLGMLNRLFGLRHRAIIGSYDQNDHVGDVGTTRSHTGECFMTGSVDEDDVGITLVDAVGTHVLGDSTRFGFGDGTLSDLVE